VELGEFSDPVAVDRAWSYDNGIDHWNTPGFSGSGTG
jgi:hypothetical protein